LKAWEIQNSAVTGGGERRLQDGPA
jgi:hypothetical protein